MVLAWPVRETGLHARRRPPSHGAGQTARSVSKPYPPLGRRQQQSQAAWNPKDVSCGKWTKGNLTTTY